MSDMMRLALQTDSTRFITFHMGSGNGVVPIEGVEEGYHTLSHHGLDEEKLEQLAIENMEDGSCRTVDAGALFIFIGARPYTEWVAANLIRNQRGYIGTGQNLQQHGDFANVWKQQRAPYLLETCEPGIFAAGDVRAGAMNRVASAVGEGSMAISFVHKYLAEN